ncbi:hypothetical protein K9N08_00055 [Candidatus Gracilibacteria bacterium]|nr:hypothetical protein [Candidatus Gracilibacteria bacterium]MCF7855943.1 hypothetical protein [Candidatus Gracilibacteria bacterium]MCF7896364.1 hypothetical protein [Candidatus Gracilibacteria bacterium]
MASPEIKIPPQEQNKKTLLERLRNIFGNKKKVIEKTQDELANLDSQSTINLEEQKKQPYFPDVESYEWDKNEDFFKKDFECKRERVSEKIDLIRDVELTFYVVRSGNTISGIRRKLAKLPEFRYLNRPEYGQKMYGFNIRPRDLNAEMLIPIPLESHERIITDEQFTNYCQKAIEEMKTDSIYEAKIRQLLKKFSEKDLLELMIAVAKQESGGKPLGQFEFHRWENHLNAFSFSIFHVVMKGPGIKARQKLKMSEGQTYHPENAAKLFLAFLFEKTGKEGIENYLPLGKHKTEARFNKFAKFYNGNLWKKYNPKYVKNLKKYLASAHDLLNGDTTRPLQKPSPDDEIRLATKSKSKKLTGKKKTTPTPTKVEPVKSGPLLFEIGETNLRQAILDANWLTIQETKTNHLQSNKNVKFFVNRVLEYLKKRYPDTGTTYYTTDQIGVNRDKSGLFLIFERRGQRAILRVSQNITQPEKSARTPKFRAIGVNLAPQAILNSNFENSKIFGKNILETNENASILANKLVEYLKKIYGKPTYFPTDQIAIWNNKKIGPHLIFQRRGKSEIIRL